MNADFRDERGSAFWFFALGTMMVQFRSSQAVEACGRDADLADTDAHDPKPHIHGRGPSAA
jgi:hypothetical protein